MNQEWWSEWFLGQTAPKVSRCLGMYFTADAVYLCEAVQGSPRPMVRHLVRAPLPGFKDQGGGSGGSATLRTSFFLEPDKLAGALRKSMDQIGAKSQHVVVSLSSQFAIVRYFGMPAVDKRFWKQSVPLEAKKYFPLPFGEAAYDFQASLISPSSEGKARLGILFGVVYKKVLEGFKEVLPKLGLTLLAMEPACCAVERLWGALSPEPPSSPTVRLHFDPAMAYVQLSQNGIPMLSREVLLGSDPMGTDRRKLDLSGCLDFVRKLAGNVAFKKVLISGAEPEAWKGAASAESGLPAESWSPEKSLGFKSAEWGAWASLGAAWRALAPASPLVLDFTASGRISEEEKQAVLGIWKVGLLASGLFLGLGLLNQLRALYYSRQLSRAVHRTGAVEAFQGKDAAQIKEVVDRMRQQADTLKDFLSQKGLAWEKMEQLADSIPEQVWVKVLDYTSTVALENNRAGQRVFRISGYAPDSDEVAAFKKNLEQDASFSRDFQRCDLSFQNDLSKANAANMSLKDLETRTSFSLVCSKKA